jgi:hypothetical protein
MTPLPAPELEHIADLTVQVAAAIEAGQVSALNSRGFALASRHFNNEELAMAMFDWTEKSAAVLRQGGVIGPDERLPWPQTGAMGVQHVIAMFGSTVLAPILMGFDTNIAILMRGIGTATFGAILLYALLNRKS